MCNVIATMITLSGSPTDLYLDVRSKWVEEPNYSGLFNGLLVKIVYDNEIVLEQIEICFKKN